eukprot:681024-Pleurochrysis_carterae.AAC.1
MKDPLEPAVTMLLTLFDSLSERCARVPAVSRALLSTWLTLFSNDSSIVRPGWHSSLLFCARSTSAFTCGANECTTAARKQASQTIKRLLESLCDSEAVGSRLE